MPIVLINVCRDEQTLISENVKIQRRSSENQFIHTFCYLSLLHRQFQFYRRLFLPPSGQLVITLRVRRSQREMYIGHGRLFVCVSVCLPVCPSPHSHTTVRTLM